MTLNQLLYFVVTCENENSMTKASEELYVTQSAISLAIRELEREFNVQLFFRNKNRLFLTENGHRFYKLAKGVVDAAKLLRNTYQDEFKSDTKLRVGMTALVQKMVSQQIAIEEWGHFSPYIIQTAYVLDTPVLLQLLDREEIDMAVIGSSRYDDMINYDSAIICDRYVHLYTGLNHPLAKKELIRPEDLRGEQMVLYMEDSSRLDTSIKVLQQFIPNLQIDHVMGYTTFLYVVEDFVERGKACALLAEDALGPNDKIKMLPIEGCKPFQMAVLWKKGRGLSAPADRYIEYLRHVFMKG